MDLLFDARLAGRDGAAASRSSSPATTTPTACTCCTGCGSAFPARAAPAARELAQWGGNCSGVNVANIDNLGNVHPDTFWWDYSLGNVRERPFSADLAGHLATR